jgi:hypothetical protein
MTYQALKRGKHGERYKNVDWSLNNHEIALLLGVQSEAVRQMRNKIAPNTKRKPGGWPRK